ncbi:tripartite tricarboxylate transporter permease [Halomonas nitroreducens]|uniref:tripartite tricarboxylate transporter permease n=1 Tax=Halomonas nitroreducens TaxID=447425 RepID=UPI002482BBC8|nr:tripartite tricarboxylate transporter permease [Halomonas nitroreducens]
MTVIGTYAIRNSLSDVIIMLTLGVVGWLLNRYGFRPSPIVLGLILGPIAEQGFVQGFLMGRASGSYAMTFFGGPISITIIALSALSVFYPLIKEHRARRRGHDGGDSHQETSS